MVGVAILDDADLSPQHQQVIACSLRAGDEARTRDLQLGRLPLYQLSYSRIV